MVSRIVKVAPFDLVVFGGTGDLAHRKLFPALFHRFLDGQLTQPTKIIGVSRQELDNSSYRVSIAKALKEFAGGAAGEESIKSFLEMVHYVAFDIGSDAGWDLLGNEFDGDPARVRAFYLATSPDFFGPVAQKLAAHSLVTPASRIIVEKPIGKDGNSAAMINDALGAVFPEKRIFRIDHYLGKETVQNLIALRFANALFEPLWNSAHIDHVEITVAEIHWRRGPCVLLRKVRRVAGHGAESFAATVMPRRHGAARLLGCGFGARRKTQGFEVAGADRRRAMRRC